MDVNDDKNQYDDTAESCVTTREAARILGIHRNTLLRLAAEGKVPSIRVGRDFRFQLSKVMGALSV